MQQDYKMFENNIFSLLWIILFLLGIDTAMCKCLQSLMRYAITAINIWPGAHNMWTRFPKNAGLNTIPYNGTTGCPKKCLHVVGIS